MATTNGTDYSGFDYDDEPEYEPESGTVAWQVEDRGRWTVTHETLDRGVTTRCGITVPTEIADSDSTSAMGRCKRCLNARS